MATSNQSQSKQQGTVQPASTAIFRGKFTDDPTKTIKAQVFKGQHFYEFMGFNLVFEDCDFSYSVFERSYMRSSKFRRCKFIGVKFLDSNFRSAEFSSCDFDFSIVQRTQISVPELLRNLPSFPNVRRDFIQQLRTNATSIGDATHVNALVTKELEAERDYWREARRLSSKHYQEKYSAPTKRILTHWNSIKLWFDNLIWGHGESVLNLSISTAICLFALAVTRWFMDAKPSVASPRLNDLPVAIETTWRLFLDLPIAGDNSPIIWASIVLFIRYLSIGLLVSIVFRRLSRR